MGVIRKPEYGETRAEYDAVLNHFNWGAFFFDWIWGLANGCLGEMKLVFVIWVLLFVPILNILAGIGYLVLKIYFGLKGNEWAYEGRAFYSPQDFEDTQRRWGLAVLGSVGIGIITMLISLPFMKSGSTPAPRYDIKSNTSYTKESDNLSKANVGGSALELLVKDIISGEKSNGTFAIGEEAADYLLDNSSYIKTQKVMFKVEKYGKNSIQMYMESMPDTIYYIFVINKTSDCDLNAKNCSVILYPMHRRGEKVVASEKVYFDSKGATKQVKLKK